MRPRRQFATPLVALLLVAGCSWGDDDVARPVDPSSSVDSTTRAASTPEHRVLAISIDGLSSHAVRTVGPERTPVLHRLMEEGASTLNARTVVEETETLPNHVSMVTSRRVDLAGGGHGITWNYDKPEVPRVQKAAGRGVESIFRAAERAGLSAAVFAAKEKFVLFQRSWPKGVDLLVIEPDNTDLVGAAVSDLRTGARAFTFVHLSLPDDAGHKRRFMSPTHLDAVERTDALVGTMISALEESGLDSSTTVIVTADHGGAPGEHSHDEVDHRANYSIPFIVWGPEVARGRDLYGLSSRLENPGPDQVGYDAPRQPVRNAALGNLAAELLELPPLRGSQVNAAGELEWR